MTAGGKLMSNKKGFLYIPAALTAVSLALTVVMLNTPKTVSGTRMRRDPFAASDSIGSAASITLPRPGKIGNLALLYDNELYEKEGPLITMLDFDWYTSTVSKMGFPSEDEDNIHYIENDGDLYGVYKAYIKYDPNNITGERADFLLFMDIEPGTENDFATLEWYWSHYLSEPEGYYETDRADSHFYGYLGDAQYHASGPGTMDITEFRVWNGVVYGVGTMRTTDGVPAIICIRKPYGNSDCDYENAIR